MLANSSIGIFLFEIDKLGSVTILTNESFDFTLTNSTMTLSVLLSYGWEKVPAANE